MSLLFIDRWWSCQKKCNQVEHVNSSFAQSYDSTYDIQIYCSHYLLYWSYQCSHFVQFCVHKKVIYVDMLSLFGYTMWCKRSVPMYNYTRTSPSHS